MKGTFLMSLGLVVAATAVATAGDAADAPTEMRTPPIPDVDIPMDHVSKTLFLNRCAGGCVVEPGRNDARFDTSSIVDQTSYISEWRHSDAVWQELVDCVKELYAPYDVVVTDVKPDETVFHHEAIVAGDWPEIGYPYPIGGVAPSQCVPANNVISFTFANGYGPNAQAICSVVGQETAHSYGLEHAFNCADPMTYLSACGRQYFRDVDAECGEFEALTNCQCGGSAQNSHRWLKSVLGANPVPVPGPDTVITTPTEAAQVVAGFSVSATASHNRGVGRVELWINGTQYGTVEGHELGRESLPYGFTTPGDLPDGVMDVEVRAYNDIDSETVVAVTVTKGAPCQSADTCLGGQECTDGRCFWPAPTGMIGDACESDAQCISGLCPQAGSERMCSESCFPSEISDSCPEGFECIEVGTNSGVCWKESSGGGICNAGGGGAGGAALLVFAAAWMVRRRGDRGACRATAAARA